MRMFQEKATRIEKKQKSSALCRAVLCPKEFDNHLFWSQIYELGLDKQYLHILNKVDFRHGTDLLLLLGSSTDGSTDYFACWPDLDELMHAFHAQLSPYDFSRLKAIIVKCCLNSNNDGFRHYLDSMFNDGSSSSPTPSSSSNDEGPPPNAPDAPPFLLGVNIEFNSDKIAVFSDLTQTQKQTSSASIALQVLGGFIAALGIATIAIAFAALNTATLASSATLITVAAGTAMLLTGGGLFKLGRDQAAEASSTPALSK